MTRRCQTIRGWRSGSREPRRTGDRTIWLLLNVSDYPPLLIAFEDDHRSRSLRAESIRRHWKQMCAGSTHQRLIGRLGYEMTVVEVDVVDVAVSAVVAAHERCQMERIHGRGVRRVD